MRPANSSKGEIFKQTKERLSKRTGLKGKRFEKIKFAVVQRLHPSNPRYLEDGKYYIPS
jgi:ubiquitin carboxyl-terminal hydrolase 7